MKSKNKQKPHKHTTSHLDLIQTKLGHIRKGPAAGKGQLRRQKRGRGGHGAGHGKDSGYGIKSRIRPQFRQ